MVVLHEFLPGDRITRYAATDKLRCDLGLFHPDSKELKISCHDAVPSRAIARFEAVRGNWSKTVHCSRRQGGEQIAKIAKIEQEQNWGRENRGEIAMEERAAKSSRGEIYRSRRFRESFEVTRP
jgi:hypothetical protein